MAPSPYLPVIYRWSPRPTELTPRYMHRHGTVRDHENSPELIILTVKQEKGTKSGPPYLSIKVVISSKVADFPA